MSEKFTPGPWEYDNRGSSVWRTEGKKDGCMVADVRGWGYLTGLASPGKVPEHEAIEIMDANGRLIAAAPEMYEALQAILPYVPISSASEGGAVARSGNVIAADKVRSALKKARGES